ncbi:IS3 family transposase [Glaciihabitans sp. dw_435]|uniref:IS3 family transposase n=1 Tax=Glaciihabitans sp. dw_435 TaxID=2720081 RepID=UPI001BD1FD73|nr:IS3 family transposase [Glaciihabitans sp. dw_435]
MTGLRACQLVGFPRASYYRYLAGPTKPSRPPIPQANRYQPAALNDAEHQQVLALLNSDDYAGFSIAQTFYRAWDAGHYVASRSSWYRIARRAGQVHDRRRQATSTPKKIPELLATRPSQVWSWDITKLHGPCRGQYFHLYVIADIFSRKIVGWRVEDVESGELAQQMMAAAVTANGSAPRYLHSDNGSAMVSGPMSLLLQKLGIAKSFSRPKVSNDNPYSEALFKTLKYDLAFPERFASLADAEAFCTWFVHEYNTNHRHSGIGWHTPNNVHQGCTTPVSAARRATQERIWRAHPERHHHGRPTPPTMPSTAAINDPHKRNPNLSHTG